MRDKSYQVQPTYRQRQSIELLGPVHVPRGLHDEIQLDFDVHSQRYSEILKKCKNAISHTIS